MNKIQIQCNNGLLYTSVTHHDKKKNALFANFHGKLAKLKIFHAKCRLFYLILIF